MGVDLGGGNAGVAKHLLDDAQVGTIVQQMRGERVAQDVRVDALVDFRLLSSQFNNVPDAFSRQLPSRVGKKEVDGLSALV